MLVSALVGFVECVGRRWSVGVWPSWSSRLGLARRPLAVSTTPPPCSTTDPTPHAHEPGTHTRTSTTERSILQLDAVRREQVA
jgi:hypothetical protein